MSTELQVNVLSNEKYMTVDTNFERHIFDLNTQIEMLSSHADKLDYLVAIGSGLLCAMMDILLVGEFDLVRGRDIANEKVNEFVQKTAEKIGCKDGDIKSSVAFLEKMFPIPSDGNTPDFGGGLQHHLRDFAHHPTMVGLMFSLLTQFTEKSYGTDTMGNFLIVPVPEKTKIFIGEDVPDKIVKGTIVWFFHLISDIAGSSSTAGLGGGTGIPGPILSMAKELATLPKLQLKDIPSTINYLDTRKSKINGYKVISHDVATNAIAYLRMYFNIDTISFEDLPYVYLLKNLLLNVSTSKYDVAKLNNLVKTYLGSLSFQVLTTSKSKNEFYPYFKVSASALNENVSYIPTLINDVLLHSKFSKKEVKQVVVQLANELKQHIIGNGMQIAMKLSASCFDLEAAFTTNCLIGPKVYDFFNNLSKNYNHNEVSKKLKEVASKLFNKNNVTISISGDQTTLSLLKETVKNIKLPSINVYSLNEECQEYPNFKYCQENGELNISELEFQEALSEYKKELEKIGKTYRNTNENWSKYYQGTIVVPIRIEFKRLYHQKKNESYHIIGFLCVDSMSTDAFTEEQENYNVDIVKSYADIIYLLLSQYKHYLKKLEQVVSNSTQST